jgi:glycosyltransferase involved in cell wall biosynthesis
MGRHGLEARVIAFPAKPRPRERAHELSETWRLLFVGRMEHLKGGLHLLDALPHVAKAAGRPVALTLAGDGSERSRWEARARTVMAQTPSVTIEFAGWVEQDAADQLLSQADLLVVPSLWPEPFGLVGPEAAQQGVPAAAFDVGGISQWLKAGVSGHLAPGNPPTPAGLAAAIGRCLADPDHYASLTRGALEVSSQFTMDRHLTELESVLGHVCR